MQAYEASAQVAIHAAFAEPILFTGGVLVEEPITAIKSDTPADGFPGRGSTLRRVSFEILQAVLPDKPEKGNTIRHSDTDWKVIDITRRDDVGAWELVVSEVR
jgi:hypothetical protein